MVSWTALAMVGGLLILGSACTGSGGGGATPTESPAPTAPPEPTAVPTPVVTGSRVDASIGIGYQADIPAGWHLRPNVVTAANFKVDGYFKTSTDPANPNQAQVNIAVGCSPLTGPAGSLADVLAEKVKGLNQLKREGVTSSDHALVDGRPAAQIDYVYRLFQATPAPPTPASGGDLALTVREILFTSDACIWTVALTVPDAPLGDDAAVLDQFLTTLRITS